MIFEEGNNFLLSLLGLISFLTFICQLQDNLFFPHIILTGHKLSNLGVGAKRLPYKFEENIFCIVSLSLIRPRSCHHS